MSIFKEIFYEFSGDLNNFRRFPGLVRIFFNFGDFEDLENHEAAGTLDKL